MRWPSSWPKPTPQNVRLGVGAGIGVAVSSGVLVAAMRRGPAMPPPTAVIEANLRGGMRAASAMRLVVLHSTESDGNARNIANYFASPSAGGSTQLVVGEDGVFRCLPDLVQPAGAPGANEDGLHIEMVGRAAWSREQWMERETTLLNAVVCVAAWCATYGISSDLLLEPGLLLDSSRTGITTHAMVSLAFRKSDHTDPGVNFPYDWFSEKLLWLLP